VVTNPVPRQSRTAALSAPAMRRAVVGLPAPRLGLAGMPPSRAKLEYGVVPIAKCVVFDHDRHRLELRLREVDRVLGALARRSPPHIAILDDNLLGRTRKADVLGDVIDHQASGAAVLVIADFAADRNRYVGNIGARLIRALAQHPVAGPGTRRIVWSPQTCVKLTEALAPWVHATATYSTGANASLADAVRHAVALGWSKPREFPDARSVEEWRRDVLDRVAELVGDPGSMPGDDLIALSLFDGTPDVEINRQLQSLAAGHRPSTMAFVTAVKRHARLASTEAARRHIEDMISDVAEDRIDDGIHPEICEAARSRRAAAIGDAVTHDEYLARTWLTPAEDELMATFLKLYRTGASNVHRNNANRLTGIVNDILGTSGRQGAPEWGAACERLGLGIPDLAHALWTITDLDAPR
jgi:hypothetical protein